MNPLLIGSFGAENIGDELILNAALTKHSSAIVMTADAKKSQEFLEKSFPSVPPFPTGIKSLFHFLKAKNWNTYKKLNKKIDQIIFPGGGLFSLSLKACLIWTIHIWWCRHFFPGKKIHLESQGIDFPRNFFARKLIQWGLLNVNSVSVRDRLSQENAQKISEKKASIVGDAVENYFKKNPVIPAQAGIQNLKTKKALLNAAKPFNLEKLIKKIDQRKSTFIAFDKNDLKKIPGNFPGKIIFPKTISELFETFQEHEIFIGQRFHFLVLAKHISPKTTFLLESPYAPKTDQYAKTNGIKEI